MLRISPLLRFGKLFAAAILGMATAAAGIVTSADALSERRQISQKGRAFQPGEISVARNETIEIVNDDGDLLHHAYIESDTFNFDSGDQEPGSHTLVTFPVSGDFNVLCGIHPKMKLKVVVH